MLRKAPKKTYFHFHLTKTIQYLKAKAEVIRIINKLSSKYQQ